MKKLNKKFASYMTMMNCSEVVTVLTGSYIVTCKVKKFRDPRSSSEYCGFNCDVDIVSVKKKTYLRDPQTNALVRDENNRLVNTYVDVVRPLRQHVNYVNSEVRREISSRVRYSGSYFSIAPYRIKVDKVLWGK